MAIVPEQRTHSRHVGGRQQVCSDVFRTDCVALRLLQVFALIVPGNGQRKAESDDETEERQDGGHDNTKIFALIFFQAPAPLTKENPTCTKSHNTTREIANTRYEYLIIWFIRCNLLSCSGQSTAFRKR
jgi:hypothetical protein